MSIEYCTEPADIAEFAVYHQRNSRSGRRQLVVGSALVFALPLVIFSTIAFFQSDPSYFQGGVILAVVAVSFYYPGINKATRREAERQATEERGATRRHYRLTADAEALVEESAAGTASTKWSAVGEIIETRTHCFIYVAHNQAHIIPKARLPAKELAVFLDEVRSRREHL